ncbi:MAG: RNA 2',3'-cyclic phosphodiesterase [Mycobacteriales bacterium]
MRLFVALRPPAPACEHLARALGRVADPRWHLTLAFLGEQPGAAPFAAALQQVRSPPVSLTLSGGLTFGHRVLAVGLAGELDQLQVLALAVRDVCRVEESRPYRPHLTLARGRGLRVPSALASYQGPVWTATELELVRSRHGEHEVLSRHPLLCPEEMDEAEEQA